MNVPLEHILNVLQTLHNLYVLHSVNFWPRFLQFDIHLFIVAKEDKFITQKISNWKTGF